MQLVPCVLKVQGLFAQCLNAIVDRIQEFYDIIPKNERRKLKIALFIFVTFFCYRRSKHLPIALPAFLLCSTVTIAILSVTSSPEIEFAAAGCNSSTSMMPLIFFSLKQTQKQSLRIGNYLWLSVMSLALLASYGKSSMTRNKKLRKQKVQFSSICGEIFNF